MAYWTVTGEPIERDKVTWKLNGVVPSLPLGLGHVGNGEGRRDVLQSAVRGVAGHENGSSSAGHDDLPPGQRRPNAGR